jgi:hypothetical protein
MTVGVVGDSVMISALSGLQTEADRRGWVLVNGAHRACPVGYEPLFLLDGTPAPGQCDGIKSLHFQLMAARPDVIVWLDINSRWARKDSAGTLLQPGTQAWKDELYPEWTMVLGHFLASGARVVIVMPPLRSQQAAGCKGVSSAARCREVQSQDAVIREATPEWFASVADRQGIHMIEVDSLLCPNGYPCPTRISGITVRETGYDQTHFTAAGAAWFAPYLFDRVLAALNGEPPPGQTG